MIVPPVRRAAATFAAALTLLGGTAATGVARRPPRAEQFVSGVNLVEVYATVNDERGEPVTGLTAADFTVEEDGRPQRIEAFAAGEFPLAAAIALDRSFSMAPDRLDLALAGAARFIEALGPSDRVMVLAIGSETDVLAPLSTERAPALASLKRVEPWGTTPLYDATLAAIEAVQAATGRRALVLISDGSDRYSRVTAAEMLEQARRRDVLVYPIALGRTRPPVFAELAAATGGRSFFVSDLRALRTALATIARELKFQYLLGYAPTRAGDEPPRWRSIRVTVAHSRARVRARDGYWSR